MRLVFVVLALVTLARPLSAEAAATVSEYRLPGYQSSLLEADLPASDAVLAGSSTLWFLGKQNLWSWRLADGRLSRIALPKGEWQRLFFDGLSVYAAGTTGLFQVQVAQKRLFSYDIPKVSGAAGPGDALGFGGEGDELWLLHARALMKIDRYGKTLTAKLPGAAVQKGDLLAFDSERQTLWIARGKQLIAAPFQAESKVVVTAKHHLDGLAYAPGQVVLHTEHSVFRIDAATMKPLKSIPVQGGRKLTAMAIGKEHHAYAFDDHLLEVFDLKAKVAHSYRLPLETDQTVELVTTTGDTAAVLVSGHPKAFKLAN